MKPESPPIVRSANRRQRGEQRVLRRGDVRDCTGRRDRSGTPHPRNLRRRIPAPRSRPAYAAAPGNSPSAGYISSAAVWNKAVTSSARPTPDPRHQQPAQRRPRQRRRQRNRPVRHRDRRPVEAQKRVIGRQHHPGQRLAQPEQDDEGDDHSGPAPRQKFRSGARTASAKRAANPRSPAMRADAPARAPAKSPTAPPAPAPPSAKIATCQPVFTESAITPAPEISSAAAIAPDIPGQRRALLRAG